MSSRRQIGRPRAFHLQNHGHLTTENDFPAVLMTVTECIDLHTVILEMGGPTFFKFTQMQSILILSSFVHPLTSLLGFPVFCLSSSLVLCRYFDI